jgi:DNA-binding response OmpR family regulator
MIALTTRFTERDQKMGLDSGFNKYLEKLKSDELLEALHYLLGAK